MVESIGEVREAVVLSYGECVRFESSSLACELNYISINSIYDLSFMDID